MRNNWALQRLAARVVVLPMAVLLSQMAWATSQYTILHAFTGKPDGGGVFAGVVIDGNGNLYGTTWGGGAYGYGMVFELTLGSGGEWVESVLHNFCKDFPHCKDGAASLNGIILDPVGDLLGTSTTSSFEMTEGKSGWTFGKICDCITPSAFDAAGNLYGIGGPGRHDAGAVVEVSPESGGWKETRLYSFCSQPPNCRDGEPRNGVSRGMRLAISTAPRNLVATSIPNPARPREGAESRTN